MSTKVAVVYPRGYIASFTSSRDDLQDSVMHSQGDDDVIALYNDYLNASTTLGLDHWRRAMDIVKRLMPNFPTFIHNNASNPRVQGVAYDFLDSTIQYVKTGRGKISPMNAIVAMDDCPSPSSPRRSYALSEPFQTAKIEEHSEELHFAAIWTSHEDGLVHLIETLYVFFGPSTSTHPVL